MTMDQLAAYLPCYGDRLAVKDFCNRGHCTKMPPRRESLFKRLQEKFKAKNSSDKELHSKHVTMVGNAIAKKTSRRIEFGWFHFDRNIGDYKQVRSRKGGGTRHMHAAKDLTKTELLGMGKKLFFPDGNSTKGKEDSFEFDVKDFSLNSIDNAITVGEMYDATMMRMLRFYLCTKEIPVCESYEDSLHNINILPQPFGVPNIADVSQDTADISQDTVDCSQDTASISQDIADVSDDSEVFLNFTAGTNSEIVNNGNNDDTIEYIVQQSDGDEVHVDADMFLNIETELDPLPMKYCIQIRRENCLGDMLHKFKDPLIQSSDINIEYINSKGVVEKGEGIGVIKEGFTQFWSEFYSQCTVGTAFKVPYIRHDFQEEEWRAAACIMKKGWDMFNYLPISLAPVWLEDVMYGQIYSDIISVYCAYVTSDEAELIKEALDSYDTVCKDDLLEFLSAHGGRQAPNDQNIKKLILELAHQELIQKPRFVTDCWKDTIIAISTDIGPSRLAELYSSVIPSARKVCKLISPPADMTSSDKVSVMKFLYQFIKELDLCNLKRFLRYCTGCDIILDSNMRIQVEYVQQTEFTRRPIGHTCANMLELSDNYNSYPEFRTEFLYILERGTWEIDIV